jgi:2-amino-4-hydroxy-6-hydroxymethyldihydropteridine diphosphokinase
MMSKLHIAFVGIGSNLQGPAAQVRSAIRAIDASPDMSLERTSSLYSSPPMGPPDQPDYVNAVVKIETVLSSFDLLESLQRIELEHGRSRTGMRWGPRTLDLDILLFDTESIDTVRLKIPHPGLTERPFVIVPLAEIVPDLMLPNGVCVHELALPLKNETLARLPND